LLKIISGGQTGVDRGALDAALKSGIECGEWCPAGRLAEDWIIPPRYPVLELANASYSDRTRRNVADADATLIICAGELSGGTRETLEFCREMAKPHLVIDCEQYAFDAAIEIAARFSCALSSRADARDLTDVRERRDETRGPSRSLGMTAVLNVAGPRASQWPEGHEIARQMISVVLRRSSGHESGVEYSEPDSPRGEF
jgi:Circularly permutated YpsA SLOG family